MRRSLIALGAALASLGSACTIASWNDFESGTSVVTLASTKPFPSQTFGTLLAAYSTTTTGGDPLSRLVVGSGRIDLRPGVVDGMVAVYSGWNDDHLALGSKLYAHCDGSASTCPPDAGTSLAPIPDVLDAHGCVMLGAPDAPASGAPGVQISCESSTSLGATPVYDATSNAAPTSRFGAAVAGLPSNVPNLGVALVTAPEANELWVVDAQLATKALPLAGLPVGAPVGVGNAMAVAPITSQDAAFLATLPPGTEHALVALSAGAENRVYVVVARFAAGLAMDATVVGCVDGLGSASTLAAGDVSGDGIPELFIGSGLAQATRSDSITVLSLADVDGSAGTARGCTDPGTVDDPVVRVLACADGSVATCTGFGASMATGDADGDGVSDLLVGAPLASVGTTSHAGAAYLFRGQSALDVFVAATNTPSVLVDSSPSVNDTLGLAVTFLPSQLREANAATDPRATPRAEPVASAPGANRVFLFLCSGFTGDSIDDDAAPPRCIVEQ